MTNLGGLKLAEGGETGRELETAEGGKAGRVGIEDLHGLVAGGAEVGTVIDCEVKVRSKGKGVQFHGAFQFKDVVVLDGVAEHGS